MTGVMNHVKENSFDFLVVPSGDNGFIYAKIYGDFEKIQSAVSFTAF